jgi:hypothetical protein
VPRDIREGGEVEGGVERELVSIFKGDYKQLYIYSRE